MHVDMKKQKTTLNACNYVIEKHFFDFWSVSAAFKER